MEKNPNKISCDSAIQLKILCIKQKIYRNSLNQRKLWGEGWLWKRQCLLVNLAHAHKHLLNACNTRALIRY